MLHSLIARLWVGRQTLCWSRLEAIHFRWLRLELLVCFLAQRGSTCVLLLLQIFSDVVRRQGFSIVGELIVSMSPGFCFILDVFMIHLFVLDDSLTS